MGSKELIDRIESRDFTVGIIGMGYVGLPLAREFCTRGFKVVGFDVDPGKVEKLLAGESYIHHIPSGMLSGFLADGLFDATADFDRLGEPDALLICVPTPLGVSREPDLSYVEATTREISKRLRSSQLVALESTTYPGTTREVMLPILEKSGLKAGVDFHLAYSPEREDPGNPEFSARNIPKVVGGHTPECAAVAVALYKEMAESVVPVSGTAAAEACKILENTYRAVNIALVNELKMLLHEMDIDVWEVIRAASTKPFGFQPFYPGPGLGGHCIPIDPFYLSWKARQYGIPTRFIELAGEVNTRMPSYVVERTAEELNEKEKALKGSKILVLGVAYKKDIDDIRESPALMIISMLRKRGAEVSYHDPYIPRFPGLRHYPGLYLESVELSKDNLASADAVLITTDHSCVDYGFVAENANLVIDTRNACDGVEAPEGVVVKA